MSASLVPLFQARTGWTNEERAQFARIERLLEDAGFAIDVEHGLSDEGEPWCVFCSRATGDVVIHVACIDGRFMFDSTALPRPIEGASFQRCAERFFEDASLPMPLNERKGRVYLHPSALLASLFITILLYAHATSEQPLFATDPVDVDEEDDALQTPEAALALRLKAIAQQVAEFAQAPDTAQAAQQGYVNPALAAIPAGMALAVIAIAQDLAHAEESGAILGDETSLALMPAPEGESQVALPPEPEVEAAEDAQGEDAAARLQADLARLAAAAAAEAAPEGVARLAPEGEPGSAEGGDLFDELISISRAIEAGALAAVDLLAGTDLGDALGLPAEEGASRAGEPAEEAPIYLTEVFQDFLDIQISAIGDAFAFALGGRVIDVEVVSLADAAFERFERAFLAEFAEAAEIESLGLDGAAEMASFGREADDAAGFGPVAPGAGARVPAGPTLVSAGLDDGQGIELATRELPVSAPRDERRVVSVEEAKALILDFMDAVGDNDILLRDGGPLPAATDLDGLLDGLLSGGRDATFLDASLHDRGSLEVNSRELTAEHIYLDDHTKLTFYALGTDFDGFL